MKRRVQIMLKNAHTENLMAISTGSEISTALEKERQQEVVCLRRGGAIAKYCSSHDVP
jgi:hypothetical protein